jgi:hypothetical protein
LASASTTIRPRSDPPVTTARIVAPRRAAEIVHFSAVRGVAEPGRVVVDPPPETVCPGTKISGCVEGGAGVSTGTEPSAFATRTTPLSVPLSSEPKW